MNKAYFCFVLIIVGAIGLFFNVRRENTASKSPVSNPPNILLITFDGLRHDHLGCYGYQRATSPTIDSLAKEGFVFNQTISQASQTSIALSSLHTGLYPAFHGTYKKTCRSRRLQWCFD
jgi:arylsulfatase A-like enzyme